MTETQRLSAYLEAVAIDFDAAADRAVLRRRRRSRSLRLVAIGAIAVALISGTALAASSLLGNSASAPIQAALDAFYPDDGEGFGPARGNAQAVARFEDVVLYRSPARNGNPRAICLSTVMIDDHGSTSIPGSGCILDEGDTYWPIGLLVSAVAGRLLMQGKVNAVPGSTLSVALPDAEEQRIDLGIDGFFLWEIPSSSGADDATPRTGRLILRDGDGREISHFSFRVSPSVMP
jgi:hypothetical protein